MADEPKPPPPPGPVPVIEEWSSISQGDLGLRAVYWVDAKKTAIVSRPIVGWISYVSRKVTETVPFSKGFAAVVIGDNWFPSVAHFVPLFVCVAPKEASDDEIIKRAAEWGASPNPAPFSPGGMN